MDNGKTLTDKILRMCTYEFLEFLYGGDTGYEFLFNAVKREWHIVLTFLISEDIIKEFQVQNHLTWNEIIEISDKFPGCTSIYIMYQAKSEPVDVFFGPLEWLTEDYHSTGMFVHQFRYDDAGYDQWLDANPTGYVFNHYGGMDPVYNKLHYSTCPHLNSAHYGSRTSIEKFCTSTMDLLIVHLEQLQLPWSFCGHCFQ